MFKSMPLALRIQTLLFLLVTLVIALGTFLSYQFSFRTLRAETVAALQASTASRASYESGPFTDAQRNTTSLQAEYLRRLDQAGNTDPQAEFDAWFVRYKDGVVRVRPERDDHKRQSSVYIRPQISLDADVRRNVMVAFKLLNEWGPAMTHNYYSAYDEIRTPGLSNSPGQKFAKLLLGWSAERGDSNHSLHLHLVLTHEEIAEMIGTTRETVSRLFGDFRKKQFIQSKGTSLVILNKFALEGMVQAQPVADLVGRGLAQVVGDRRAARQRGVQDDDAVHARCAGR